MPGKDDALAMLLLSQCPLPTTVTVWNMDDAKPPPSNVTAAYDAGLLHRMLHAQRALRHTNCCRLMPLGDKS